MSLFEFPFILAFVLAARMEMMVPQPIESFRTEKACADAAKERNKSETIKTDGARGVGAAYVCYSLIGSI
jgi:hypothetical protein